MYVLIAMGKSPQVIGAAPVFVYAWHMIHLFPSREIFFTIGAFSLHWYGLMYLAGFLFGWFTIPRLQKYRGIHLTRDELDALVFYVAIGVLVGARVGEVFFWDFKYYMANPSEILKVWHGGMSSHGGFIAVLIMFTIYCRKYKVNFWAMGDVLIPPVAVALIFGRFGNFINQEIYGTVTTVPWAMHFDGVEGLRHPTQIYAMIKDATIATTCYFYLRSTVHQRPGRVMALFFMMYGVLRFIVEYYRDQSGYPPHHFGMLVLTQGQLLTIPFFLLGVWMWWYRRPDGKTKSKGPRTK